MISATGIELRAGARILIENATFRVAKGDRIGLVGRNGAGKTTLTKCLAGEGIPAAGTITRSGEVGYLPQDPRTGDLDVLARDRVLSARGLDTLLRKMRENEQRIANGTGATRAKAMKQYERQETEFLTKGGYAAEAEAATIAAALNLPDRVLGQPLHTLSGGQRRRIELARILFSDADTLLLDEPTNNLDPASREEILGALRTYKGAVVLVTHDEGAVEALQPERIILLPDGVEDLWGSDYADLVALA
ncbi:ATP-binding cassette domain-containing protein [Streptomyces sp. SID8366]|uniref:ATP-binding cassette domain-containing protein n=1 Tax=Streptomyces sp. SID8366 TaxID=2690348 RepID=UPI000DBAC823|nr:ATP-binding cassette domain-containing protein [Streptomyces sp. PsTaAH-130]MYU03430.1 ATP-binding cassette domain-containing protein [Streptomyces sp. SID8366]RAJ51485.1 ABC transporter family protein [Streptomyces sp. PsTaAH-130]